jgi:hypothetical protein
LTTGIGPQFSQQPTPATEAVFQNQTVALSALATGIPSPWYQWQYESGTTWSSLGVKAGTTPNASTLLYSNWTSLTITNFRCIVSNHTSMATSSVALVTTIPVANYNKGIWTVNFAVATTSHGGPGTPYVGPGVLGTNTYWNALGGSQMANTPPSLRDDGVTQSGVNFGTTNAFVNPYSSAQYYTMSNNLLDQYAQITDTNNGMNFFFTHVPKGKYNLALYGCTAAWADRGEGFTVYTNGVSAGTQWVTNAQDTFFFPYDNTVVFTNLLIMNGMLQVNESLALAVPAHTNSTEADFNGAQLELVTAGPDIWSITNKGTNMVLTFVGGGLMQSTNLMPGIGTGWVTNPAVSPYTFAPTGAQRFFKIVNYHFP